MKKVALITGVTGQDGSYLAEFLLEKFLELRSLVAVVLVRCLGFVRVGAFEYRCSGVFCMLVGVLFVSTRTTHKLRK